MNRMLLCWAIALVAASGVADQPGQATPARKDDPLLLGLADSTRPADRELVSLLLQETIARSAISMARDRAEQAAEAWKVAAYLLEQKTMPPGVRRPSREDVQALEAAFHTARMEVARLYREHVARYEALLARYPTHWRGYHKLAWFYADFGDQLASAEAWRRTIELKPDFAYAYNNLATVYNHLGRDMESIDLYAKAISLLGDEPEFHFNLANVISTHRFEAAHKFGWTLPRLFEESMKHYRAARDLRPDSLEYAEAVATNYVFARHFEVEDWADAAIQDWDYCLRLPLDGSQRTRALTNVARILLRQKQAPARAIEVLEQAKKLDAHNPTIQTLLDEARRRLAEAPAH